MRHLIILTGSQLSVERQNGSQWAFVAAAICVMVLLIMGAFAFLYFIKRNDRIQRFLFCLLTLTFLNF
ncbi:unnamed protein product, partial [Rotaria sordida]